MTTPRKSRLSRYFQSSRPSPSGITNEPMQQAAENLTVTEVHSRIVSGIGTLQSATQSEPSSMDEVTLGEALDAMANIPTPKTVPQMKAKVKEARILPSFTIQTTPCCGMHTVHGYQYSKDPDPICFFLGIEKSYVANRQMNITIDRENNEEAVRADRENRRPVYPYPNGAIHPKGIPGMLVFTWQAHEMYLASAKKLSDFVKERGMGECFITGTTRNPNSGHLIQSMTWCVEQDGYKKFLKDAEL